MYVLFFSLELGKGLPAMSLCHKDSLQFEVVELPTYWGVYLGVALSFDVAFGGTLPPSSGYI